MTTLNVLIVEDEKTLIAKAREAYMNSFEILNNKAALDVKINIFPDESEQEGYISDLLQCAKNAEDYNKQILVFNYIKTYLDKYKINVILLDFIIIKSDEEKMKQNLKTPLKDTTGEKILSSIRKSKYKNIPILGYTQLKDEVQKLQTGEKGTLFQIDKNNFTKSYFKENQGHLHDMLSEVKKYQNEIENQCDIVVVCALKKEIIPVINLLKDKISESETFAIGYIENKNNTKLKVVAISKEQMGMAEAATLTTQMIEQYNPLYVVMTGIAGGIDAQGQKFLNILMPSYIHNWQSGKYKEKQDNNEEEKTLHVFEREYSSVKTYIEEETDLNIDADYLKNFPEEFLKSENFEGTFNKKNIQTYLNTTQSKLVKDRSEFEKEIVKLFENEQKNLENEISELGKSRKKNKDSKVKILREKLDNLPQENKVIDFILEMVSELECNIQKDGMVSGSAVVADGYIVEEHIGKRKVNGIDMEAYGVVYACNHHPKKPKPKVVILKAICDFADNNKNDIYQTAAAYVSARAFHNLFTKKIDVEPKL